MTGKIRTFTAIAISLLALVLLSACNLQTNPEEQMTPTAGGITTVTPTAVGLVPTPITGDQVTTIPLTIGASTPVTAATPSLFPTTASDIPININIAAPQNGQLVSGTVGITGSAVHPNFLQYQLQYATDPNPSGAWNLIGPVMQIAVENGLLGAWDTSGIVDGQYQLQLDVVLRDGSSLVAGVSGLHVQNHAPTAAPTATPVTPRPLASFTQNSTSGTAPLTVTFANLSSGYITTFQWSFGDGTTSSVFNPVHTYNKPGTYAVSLTVTGPGGQANIANTISVQGQAPPVAAFAADKVSGVTPLTVTFTNQSTGNFSNAQWNFGDGTYGDGNTPTHTFTGVGTYNVILTVSGAGGTSTTVHAVTVQNQSVAAPVARFSFSPTRGQVPLTVAFTNASQGSVTQYIWNFGDGAVTSEASPSHIFTRVGSFVVTLIAIGPGGQSSLQATVVVTRPPTPPPTKKPRPTATFTPTKKPRLTATPKSKPSATAPATQIAQNPTDTPLPPPPSATPVPPTVTIEPSATLSLTPLPPTATSLPADTATPQPPTATPTETAVPPTKPPTQAPPDLSDTQPVIPVFTDANVKANLQKIFVAGAKAGRKASVFALVGDESAMDANFLEPFGNPQTYTLDQTTQPLKTIIDWYSQTPIGSDNSWTRRGIASKPGWTVANLLDASRSDSGQCQAGETPFACELRITNASVVIISVGFNDILQKTDPTQFQKDIAALVVSAIQQGVIPVLVTMPPRLDGKVSVEQIHTYNNIIITVAHNRLIPVINSWRVINGLPGNGLNADQASLSVAPNGAGDLQVDALQFGANRRNSSTLNSLNALRNAIFPKVKP